MFYDTLHCNRVLCRKCPFLHVVFLHPLFLLLGIRIRNKSSLVCSKSKRTTLLHRLFEGVHNIQQALFRYSKSLSSTTTFRFIKPPILFNKTPVVCIASCLVASALAETVSKSTRTSFLSFLNKDEQGHNQYSPTFLIRCTIRLWTTMQRSTMRRWWQSKV